MAILRVNAPTAEAVIAVTVEAVVIAMTAVAEAVAVTTNAITVSEKIGIFVLFGQFQAMVMATFLANARREEAVDVVVAEDVAAIANAIIARRSVTLLKF
jgi:hypothetical protein